jgi:hypothetical protein
MDVLRRTCWSPHQGPNSLIAFIGELKKPGGRRNQNQLVLDFATAQYQRYALGLPDRVIWGVECSMGCFGVYSSNWSEDHLVCPILNRPCLGRSLFC